MALDGLFFSKIKDELERRAVGARIDKVQQPSKDEVLLSLRGKAGAEKLLCCVRADAPRLHLTAQSAESPQTPPMFCMLLRKYLVGARITGVRQLGLDRLLFLDLDAANEIGDRIGLTLCAETMGTYSNLILVGPDGRIIDAAKRIDFAASSERQILPGLPYVLPRQQEKLCLETETAEAVTKAILSKPAKALSSAALQTVQGISPLIAREIAYRCTGADETVGALTDVQKQNLLAVLREMKNALHRDADCWMVLDKTGAPREIASMRIYQYEGAFEFRKYDSPSALLDGFYAERDRTARLQQRGRELFKAMHNLNERTLRRVTVQKDELRQSADRDKFRLWGELITANLHRLQKGSESYTVENYYDNMQPLTIRVDPALDPTQNANRFYKEYRKAKTAEAVLTERIAQGEAELQYFDTVLDALSRAESERELSAIREELSQGGYLRKKSGKKLQKQKPLPPMAFRSSDGYRILVGRNNTQNDRLSLKTANKRDWWFHTQQSPGSHVILETVDGEASDTAMEEAAVIAATCSKAKDSSLVPVDYTRVKQLKKPVGAKPGKVIYHEYYTMIVTPDKEKCNLLREE
jgi:predicted ribosome quality control (RQC) complex YloA/Tae2 family protein